jgi:hypothetical protein
MHPSFEDELGVNAPFPLNLLAFLLLMAACGLAFVFVEIPRRAWWRICK